MYRQYNYFPEAVVILNNNKIIYHNNMFTKLFSANEGRTLFKGNILKTVHFDFKKKLTKYLRSLQNSTQISDSLSIKMINGKKQEIWVRLKGCKGETGTEVLLTLEDITDEVNIRTAFKENEDRFTLLTENQVDAVAIFDENGVIRYVNPAALILINAKSTVDVIGRPLTRFLTKKSIEETMEKVKMLFEGGRNLFPTYESYVNLEGKIIPVQVYASIVKYNGQKAVQTIIRDMTLIQGQESQLFLEKTRYRNLLNSLPDALIIHSRNKILFINKKGVEYTGFESHLEVLNHTIAKFFEPIPEGASKTEINNFLKGKDVKISSLKMFFKRIDGNKFPVKVITSHIVYENKEAIRLLIRDITEKERALKRLQETENRLQLLIETSPDIICFKDGEGRWLLSNKANIELFDLQGVDYYGKTDTELAQFTPFHRDAFLTCTDTDEKTWKKGKLSHNDEIIPTKHSGIKVYDVFKIPLFNPNKSRNGLVVIGRDVTETRKSQNKLREQQEQLELIVNKTPALLAYADSDVNYLYVNQAYATFYHTTPELMKGKPAKDFLTDSYYQSIEPYISSVLEGKEVYYENKRRNNKGETIFVKVAYIPHFDNHGQVNAFLAMIEDITELKTKEIKLTEALVQAEVNDRLKHAFLSNLSHEFRTPMNAVVGFAQLIKDEPGQSPLTIEYLNIITMSTYHLLDLLTSVIELSQIEAGDIKIAHEPVNINKIINDLYEEHRTDAKIKDLNLHFDTPLEDKDAILLTDGKRLTEIIRNMVNNAIKFTNKGSIAFGYRPMKDTLKFYVKDTGIGIPYEQQEAIFEHFRQVEVSHTRHYGGAGVGLTTCKHLVKHMGGEIWLHSVPEKGSSFYFTLPWDHKKAQNLLQDPKKKPNQATSKTDFSLFNGKTILISEDESDVILYYQALFRKSGIELLIAANGRDCLEMVKNQNKTIDLILMDIRMEDIDGIMLTKQIRSEHPEIPIIVQTAFIQNVEINDAKAAGADDFITKPINKDKLFVKMKKLILLEKNP